MIKKIRDILRRLLMTRAAWPIVLTIGLLCTASILALDLASPERASRQQIHVALGALVILAVLVPHYLNFGRLAYVLYTLTIILLIAVFWTTPRGGTAQGTGATRWFQIGESVQVQPSEIAKITFVLAIAWYLRYRRDLGRLSSLLVSFLLMLVPFVLILREPDLGTALLFPLTLYAMLVAAGAKLRHLVMIAVVVILSAPGAFPFLKPYQQDRFRDFVKPMLGLSDLTHQQERSRTAVGAGKLWGQGVQATPFAKRLPEWYTDFIFSVVALQRGFVGGVLIVLLYLAFMAASLEIAASTKDQFGRLMVVGMLSMILFQAMINIAMTVVLGPVVGISLPFVSYGGSSLILSMAAAGLMLNVSVRRQVHFASMPQYALA